MNRVNMHRLNSVKSTRSKTNITFPQVCSPLNWLGVFPKTTASAPVDIVHANHGLYNFISSRDGCHTESRLTM
jgi:hypothetical protein